MRRSQGITWLCVLTSTYAVPTLGQSEAEPSSSASQEAGSVSATEAQDPLAILKQACDQLAGAKSFEVATEISIDEVTDEGHKVEFAARSTVKLKRPDCYWSESSGDTGDRQVCFNRGQLMVYSPTSNVFACLSLPPAIDEAIDTLATQYDMVLPLADLLLSDPYAALTTGMTKAVYVGQHGVGEHVCHHLLFENENVNWQAWVDVDRPVIRKIVIRYTREPGAPQFRCLTKGWRFDALHDYDAFVLRPPSDAERIEIEPESSEVAEEVGVEKRSAKPDGEAE